MSPWVSTMSKSENQKNKKKKKKKKKKIPWEELVQQHINEPEIAHVCAQARAVVHGKK